MRQDEFQKEFLVWSRNKLQEIASNVKEIDMWKIQIVFCVRQMKEITDLKYCTDEFDESQLPVRSYNNFAFIAAILIVQSFLKHPFGYRCKQRNIEDREENELWPPVIPLKLPNIRLDYSDDQVESYGFTLNKDIYTDFGVIQAALPQKMWIASTIMPS